jgi:hypothetical protein
VGVQNLIIFPHCLRVKSLKLTHYPNLEAGIADHVWSLEEVIAPLEKTQTDTGPCGDNAAA